MSTYTLILTLNPENGNPVIHTIPGFSSFEEAHAIGREWSGEQYGLNNPSFVVAPIGG